MARSWRKSSRRNSIRYAIAVASPDSFMISEQRTKMGVLYCRLTNFRNFEFDAVIFFVALFMLIIIAAHGAESTLFLRIFLYLTVHSRRHLPR